MNILNQPYVKNLLVRYRTLERRDQTALIGLGIFLGVLVLYYGVWLPSNEFFESRQLQRNRELSLITYMRASEDRARASSATSGQNVSGQALLTQISQTAQHFKINPNRLQPEGSNGVSVWFDDVPFNDLVRWLEQQSQKGITIRQISIDRGDDEGKVKARIVFRS